MNQNQYFALCDVCDDLLLSPSSTIERVAIDWLHVLRPHPEMLGKYSNIFFSNENPCKKSRYPDVRSSLAKIYRRITADGKPWCPIGKIPRQTDVLIISHLVNETHLLNDSDFYYGKISCKLHESGIKCVTALINHTNKSSKKLASNSSEKSTTRVILSNVLGVVEELRLYWRSRCEGMRLAREDEFNGDQLKQRLIHQASLIGRSGGAVGALRLGEQIMKLVGTLRPRALLVTYEGHSWERVAFASARSINPNILCIGYQHAAIFNFQHAIFRSLDAQYNPDVILTSGKVSKEWMLNNRKSIGGCRVDVLGSNRSTMLNSIQKNKFDLNGTKKCLVVPEGYISECKSLFGYALKCAILCPEIKFIWRLHPALSFEKLIKNCPEFKELPNNIELSNRSLEDDISASTWVLYRGSTAVIQAVTSGLIPVYLATVNEIEINPLFEKKDLHFSVINPVDLISVLKESRGYMNCYKHIELQKYCCEMYTELNIDALVSVVLEKQTK